ncbi:MAG: hypothetical protein V1810_03440 [Candidatus Beckwithbacteria bacterium]
MKKFKPILFLKVDVAEAVEILDRCILDGYQLKDKIEAEYKNIKHNISVEKLTDWQNQSSSWVGNCINKLQQIYVSPRESYNFRDAKNERDYIPFTANPDYLTIIDMFEAKIKFLNECLNFILQRPNVLFYSKRDLFVQFGPGTKQEVKN